MNAVMNFWMSQDITARYGFITCHYTF